jgi:hypothetical protein
MRNGRIGDERQMRYIGRLSLSPPTVILLQASLVQLLSPSMRKFLKLKQRDPRLPTPGLEPSKAILTIVSSLGDGVVGVPGLKTAAQIVIKIIEVAQVRAAMM